MEKKLKKLMEAGRAALKEADEEKDPAKKSELIAKARKLNDEFLTEAKKASFAEGEKPANAEEAAVEESSKGDMCAKDSKESDDDMDESKEDAADGDSEDAPKGKKKKGAKKKAAADDGDDDEDSDAVEANRIAVQALMKESGVMVGAKRAARLERLSLKEAREEIEMLAEDQKLLTRSIVKAMQVPAAHLAKMTEAEKDGASESNNHLFEDRYR